MQWFLLHDQSGMYWVVPYGAYNSIKYFSSTAIDGSQPIYMSMDNGLTFIVTTAQFTSIVGTLPAVQNVTRPS